MPVHKHLEISAQRRRIPFHITLLHAAEIILGNCYRKHLDYKGIGFFP
jgi:hypothetical protein